MLELFQTNIQKRIYSKLMPVGTDVKIDELYMAAHPGEPIERMVDTPTGPMALPRLNNRDMQQLLGSTLANMNAKLAPHGLKIEPGQIKQTYRLSNIAS